MNRANPRIDGYHAHIYYDATTKPKAQHLAAAVTAQLSVEIGGFSDEPVGPHPVGNLQLIFKPAEFASIVPWLMMNRDRLSVLVHPLSDDAVRDHDGLELWLGTPVPLRLHRMTPDYTPDLLPST
jgi:aromatic ring-cleaving dioxygenase